MSIERINRSTTAALGFLTVAGVFAGLAVAVKLTLNAPAIDADRAAERSQALAEIRVTEEKSLATAAPLDAQRGIMRLPIDDAMKLSAQKWRNPSAARADLNARAEKAAAELPKVPEKPSAFE